MRRLKRLICICFALLLLCGCGAGETSAPDAVQEGSTVPASPVDTAVPAPPTPTPAPTPAPTPSPVPETAPAEEIPAAETAPPAPFFADAAFFGNSLMDGLHRFGGMDCGSFFAGTSASVISVGIMRDAVLSDGSPATMLDALLERQYGKVFFMLGINELGFTTQSFAELYGELLDTVAAAEPEAALYVLSLTPITEKRSNSADLFTREKVLEFNAAIAAMAEAKGVTYVDLYTPFADENGWLPAECSTDGVHFTTEMYGRWAAYLHEQFPD